MRSDLSLSSGVMKQPCSNFISTRGKYHPHLIGFTRYLARPPSLQHLLLSSEAAPSLQLNCAEPFAACKFTPL